MTCKVLDVAVQDVDQYVEEMKQKSAVLNGKVLHLHLGVGPNKVYHLEQVCYNQKDFRIPDNRQNQPLNQPILMN